MYSIMAASGYAWLFEINTLIALVTWIGIVQSYLTMQTFKLRHWKRAAYMFLGGMFLFMAYKLFQPLILPEYYLIGVGLQTGFLALLIAGIYQLRRTAVQTGGG
ncbi:MAG: hypothetical protein MUP66_01400 [Candidatus Nanohaloarchaeota archaeon QJJ-5]|nr:hypothetical protein [Candidatus Nanohaloarchaeota archaeon QJJ-5]